MAPKANAKPKATKMAAKTITAKVKKGKWIGKQLRKEAVPKLKLKNEDGAEDEENWSN